MRVSERVLSESGFRAELKPSKHHATLWTLTVDGTPQSQIDLEAPEYLAFEYVRRIGHAVDLVAPAGAPITALHLGAGALTLPRYIEATRPGSRQQVIELERDLIDLVRAEIPWSKQANIRVRNGDARQVLGKLPSGLSGAIDLAVVDIFSGARTPAHVTSVEFYENLVPLMAPHGVVTVNIADGQGLAFAKRQLATLAALWPELAFTADTAVLKGRRFGNVVAYASAHPLPFAELPRRLAGDPFAAKVVAGDELRRFVAGVSAVHDDTATPSPLPGRSVFVQRG